MSSAHFFLSRIVTTSWGWLASALSNTISFSSQMLLSGLYVFSSRVLVRTNGCSLLLFFLFFQYGFFEDLCFLDSLLRIQRDPGGNGRTVVLPRDMFFNQ